MLNYIFISILSMFICDKNSVRYRVSVADSDISHEMIPFALKVFQTLKDKDGWSRAGVSFCLTAYDPDIDIILASPDTVDVLCSPINTGGEVSCAIHSKAVINHKRWNEATDAWDNLGDYRRYVINHEAGHVMGMIHRRNCTSSGNAPLMMQQSRDILKCNPNSYPTSHESLSLRKLRRSE